MPLRITNPVTQVGTLNKWADYIETQLKATNTKIFRVANTAVATAPAKTGSGGIGDLIYDGNEFTIQNPTGPTTTIVKNPQPPHTVFAAPIEGLSNYLGYTGANYSTGTGTPVATNPTITFTPQQFPSWIYYIQESAGNSNTSPAGWTALLDGSVLQVPSTAPITATDPTAPGFSWANVALQFSGTIPSIVNQAGVNLTQIGTSASASQTFSTTAGDAIIVSVRILNNITTGGVIPAVVEDTQGNEYSIIGYNTAAGSGFNGPVSVIVFATGDIPGGAVTVKVTTGHVTSVNARANFIEFSSLGAGLGIPVFRPIAPSDLPAISGNSIATGLVGLKVGGTGADLSTAGGPFQVVQQGSVGAPFSSGQIDYPFLAGLSPATLYAGNSLAGKGLPSIVFQSLQTRGGNDTFTVGTLSAGIYRVSVTLIAIVGTLTSDTIPECDFTFNDPTLAATTIILTPTTNYLTPGTITTYTSQSVILSITASSPASFSTTGYLGTGTYRIVMQVEQI